jgi:hypothetical protein
LLSKALRLQSHLLDDHVVSGIEPIKGGSEGGEGFVKESHSAKDTGAVSSALSSLISVTQRVFNSLQGRFHSMSCIPQSEVMLLYVDRQMLLIRVLLAAAINPINGAPESSQKARGASPCNNSSSSGRSSSGSLSYPSAKLLKDLLLLLDSNIADAHTHALCTSSSSTFSPISSPSSSDSISDRLQLMVDTLHCSVPRQLLVLCRRLTSTDFVTTFNTQVPFLQLLFVPFFIVLCYTFSLALFVLHSVFLYHVI